MGRFANTFETLGLCQLACANDSETKHVINEQTLSLMKPTAYVINTSRGGLIDHAALAAALDAGRIAGAGLDVQDPEPPNLQQAPYNDPRVIVTPHAAFVSQESLINLRSRTAQQVADCLTGKVQRMYGIRKC